MATKKITDQSFAADVINAGGPVLVDFWAEWCGPCRMVGPIIDQLAGDYAGRAKVAKLDVDSSAGTARRFDVRSIPTILFLSLIHI